MKIKKNILFGAEARQKLLNGFLTLFNAVGTTLGPKGRNVAINNDFTTPTVLHDGVSVARELNLEDDFEDMGAELLKAAAIKTNDTAGDGTTTATVLATSIFKRALESIEQGENPMTLKKEIEESRDIVLEELKLLAKPISDDDKEIEQVATVSSADPVLGKLVAEAIKKVGKDGTVTVEKGSSFDTTVTYQEGLKIDKGYLSSYFVNQKDTTEAIFDNPYILITDKKLNYAQDIADFLTNNPDTSRGLVIFAAEFLEGALQFLVLNKLNPNVSLNVVAVQSPAYGLQRVEELEDLATITGGVAVLEDSGRDIKTVTLAELGRAEKVIVSRDSTVIINGSGNKALVAQRVDDLRKQLEYAKSDYEKMVKSQRLARLTGGVATINVGAATEVEADERKERVIDAVNATKAAIEEGVVAGGEVTLYHLSRSSRNSILSEALKSPHNMLMHNAGVDNYALLSDYPFGVDVMDYEPKDMIKAGIIDPAKVTRCVIENAVSVAIMALTTDVLMTNAKEKP